jgi:hypothetical protein
VSGRRAGAYPPVSAERAYLAGAGGAAGLFGGELVYALVAVAALALAAWVTMGSRGTSGLEGNERTGGAS